MKTKILGALATGAAVVCTLALAAAHLSASGPTRRAEPERTSAAAPLGTVPGHTTGDVARGAYLVTAIGCGDCHTPKRMGPKGPEQDPTRLLQGHPEGAALPPAPALPPGPWLAVTNTDLTAWSGPWGTSFAFNLTPDENTGIGSWSEKTFVEAIRTGRHMGVSRPILPPMPWENFRHLSDQDLRSIYAYLHSIPPIHNRVPEPLPPAPAATVTAAR